MILPLSVIKADEEMKVYFNWTCNALLPIYSGAADRYFEIYRETIIKVSRQLLRQCNCSPQTVYRGIILRQPAKFISPHPTMKYLSFSEDIKIAKHFANVHGFGSDIVDVEKYLGKYGYVIEYTPTEKEILFHHNLLYILPYAEAFQIIGINGRREVDGLKKQMEVMIEQPQTPLPLINSLINKNVTT